MFLEKGINTARDKAEARAEARVEADRLLKGFKENTESEEEIQRRYGEWKRQQPVKDTRVWDCNHSTKRERDYSMVEEMVGFEMDDPEIMVALDLYYAVLPVPPVVDTSLLEEED
jgi:hypothetical protein